MEQKILIDTNAMIYYLNGMKELEFISKISKFYYSFINKIELLSFRTNVLALLEEFLFKGEMITINNEIINKSIEIRKTFNLKIPDAIITATALIYNLSLLTADKEIISRVDTIKIIDPFKD